MKLTDMERAILEAMTSRGNIRAESEDFQEAVCQLDAKGFVSAYTDTAYSSGVVVAGITDAGRAALREETK